ncbi:MAG: peptide transporter, partial [candidate division Zixibacteria bacterium]|nr:peptide transporter [candidate division Zixibacteria bacterium]
MSVPEKPASATTDADYRIVPEDTPYRDGFNMRTVWAALFIGFVMTPGAIYLDLVTGQNIAGAGQWVTIIMFIEISKRLFIRLSPQETIILYWLAGGLTTAGSAFQTFIWNQYLIQSPYTDGITQYIPDWVVPGRDSEALAQRTFFHADWTKPVLLMAATTALGFFNSLSMGYLVFRVTNDIERLPFPLAPVQAGGATALAESSSGVETWRWRVFSIGSVIGMAWGLVYAGVPTLTGILFVNKIEFIPIPFADFTTQFQSLLPATPIGLGTDLGAVLT